MKTANYQTAQELRLKNTSEINTKMQLINEQDKGYFIKLTGERSGLDASASPKQQKSPPSREGQGWAKIHCLNVNRYKYI